MLELSAGTKKITTERPSFIMGIVNATPDSFYKNSRSQNVDFVLKMIDDGADIIDIGGESTRPDFKPVSAEEEINRILPLIKEIRRHSDIPISVDTTKYEVIKAAFEEGADILNDVSALEGEKKAEFCAENNLSVVLMHSFPSEHEIQASYDDVVEKVRKHLKERADYALNCGIKPEKIIVDPGIGFGKTFEENVCLIKNCTEITLKNEFPILMALSRKRCIGQMCQTELDERLYGTLAANMFSVIKGAKIVRVHDIKATRDMLNIVKYML